MALPHSSHWPAAILRVDMPSFNGKVEKHKNPISRRATEKRRDDTPPSGVKTSTHHVKKFLFKILKTDPLVNPVDPV